MNVLEIHARKACRGRGGLGWLDRRPTGLAGYAACLLAIAAAIVVGGGRLSPECAGAAEPADVVGDASGGPGVESPREPDPGVDGEERGGDLVAGDRRMREALAEIASLPLGDNPLVGPEFARTLREQLDGLAPDSPAEARAALLVTVARTELWSGNNTEAIEMLTRAVGIADRLEPPEHSTLGGHARFWLGVAHLRDGEQRNCIAAHSAESCIVPLAGRGVHADKGPGRAAVAVFNELLDGRPTEPWIDPAATWLLNIAYMTIGEFPDGVPIVRRAELFAAPDFPRFAQVAGSLGLDVFDLAGGVVVDDINGDGLLDVLFSTSDTRGELRLFTNVGDEGFRDDTAKAGLTGLPGGLNMVQADYDNDGDVDVLVLRGAWLADRGRHPNSLLRNEGDGTFVDVTFAAGLGEVHYPTQAAAWADYDIDGDLDLYVGNESSSLRPGAEPHPDQLFRNDGDGTFTDVAGGAGLGATRFTKAVVWGDYDDDGFPDLFVSDMHGPNRLYHNNRGDGTFTDVAPALELTRPARSFGAWFWDYDNDGALDLFIAGYAIDDLVLSVRRDLAAVAAGLLGRTIVGETSRLWRGDGAGGFTDVTDHAGLARVTLPMGLNFGDLDNDGFLDFYLATGYPGLEALVPNFMYQNIDGVRFRDVTTAGGFGHLQKGHGVAFADIDDDGDQDVVNQLGGFYTVDRFANAVYENPGFGRHWIHVTLAGTRSNRSAIGARIRVDVSEKGRARSIYRWVGSGASFGANPLRAEIGLGGSERVDRLEVRWPGKRHTQSFEGLAVDRAYRVTEGIDEISVIDAGR